MRLSRRYLFSALCSLALSVTAYAAPVNLDSVYMVMPQLITNVPLAEDSSAMTNADFVVPAPYTIVVEAIEQVPIDTLINEAAQDTDSYFENMAVVQNTNFERMLSI